MENRLPIIKAVAIGRVASKINPYKERSFIYIE